jgi:hypothetical protein
MFLAATLDSLPGVVGLHEGHSPGDPPEPRLPRINVHNRRAWHDSAYADRTVAEMRDRATLVKASGDATLLVDVAFYNAPLLVPLARRYPDAALFAIVRRCEGFVRSATIVTGEDRQPAGWPDRSKPLTDRERFISLGRLKPESGSDDAEQWPEWSAIQRNIWLWHSVNAHLLRVAESHSSCHLLLYEDLVGAPRKFWARFLRRLGRYSESNLARCLERSTKKINQRASYQAGSADTWSEAELALYERLARPLERKLYD